MFIGGLSWQTTPENVREYFSQFGDVAEVMVMKDPATRRSRGFGFITFSNPGSVNKVLAYPAHQLDGKIIEPKVTQNINVMGKDERILTFKSMKSTLYCFFNFMFHSIHLCEVYSFNKSFPFYRLQCLERPTPSW